MEFVRWLLLAMEAFQPKFDPKTLVKSKERANYTNFSSDLYRHAAIWVYTHTYTH